MTVDPINQVLADIDLAIRQGQQDKAIQLTQDSLEIFPDHPELTIRLEQLEACRAARTAGRAPALPSGIPSRYLGIRDQINSGDSQTAIDELRDWVEKPVPGQATAHYLAGIALQELNKIPRGISFLKRALHGEDLPEDLRIYVHYENAPAPIKASKTSTRRATTSSTCRSPRCGLPRRKAAARTDHEDATTRLTFWGRAITETGSNGNRCDLGFAFTCGTNSVGRVPASPSWMSRVRVPCPAPPERRSR